MEYKYNSGSIFISMTATGIIDESEILNSSNYANIELRFKHESGNMIKCFRLSKCKFAFATSNRDNVVYFKIGLVESAKISMLISNLNNSLFYNVYVEEDRDELIKYLGYILCFS